MFFVLIGNQRWPPLKEKFNIGSYEENISKLFQSETNETSSGPMVNLCLLIEAISEF
jgi:hypothetical protein